MLFKCIFEKIDKTYRKMFYNGRIRWKNLQLERKTKKTYFSEQRKWRESFSDKIRDVLIQHLDKKKKITINVEKWRNLIEKKPGQMENRENSCSQVCKEEINILI